MNQSHQQLKQECLNLDPINAHRVDSITSQIQRLALEPIRDLCNDNGNSQATIDQTFEEIVAEVEAQIQNLRQEFQVEDGNVFHRLIVEQICTAWVQWFVAGVLLDANPPDKRQWRENNYFNQRYLHCQNRLTQASDQLAKIRCIPSHKLHLESLAEKLAKQKERDEEAAKWTEKFSRSFKA